MLPKKSALDYFRESQAAKPGMMPSSDPMAYVGSPASPGRIEQAFAPSPRASTYFERQPDQSMFGPQAFQGAPFAGAPPVAPPNPTYTGGPQAARATGAAAAAPMPPPRPPGLGEAMAAQATPQPDTTSADNPWDKSIPGGYSGEGYNPQTPTDGGAPKPPGQGFADLVSGLFKSGAPATAPATAPGASAAPGAAPFGGAGGMTGDASAAANIGQLLKLFGIGV